MKRQTQAAGQRTRRHDGLDPMREEARWCLQAKLSSEWPAVIIRMTNRQGCVYVTQVGSLRKRPKNNRRASRAVPPERRETLDVLDRGHSFVAFQKPSNVVYKFSPQIPHELLRRWAMCWIDSTFAKSWICSWREFNQCHANQMYCHCGIKFSFLRSARDKWRSERPSQMRPGFAWERETGFSSALRVRENLWDPVPALCWFYQSSHFLQTFQ